MKRHHLRILRLRNGLSQKEMAEKLDISESHYKGIENGFADPSYKTSVKYLEVFGRRNLWRLFNKGKENK